MSRFYLQTGLGLNRPFGLESPAQLLKGGAAYFKHSMSQTHDHD